MLLIDGGPTQDLVLLQNYNRNLVVIVKNGQIRKNPLGGDGTGAQGNG
jgi:hypothetical protein